MNSINEPCQYDCAPHTGDAYLVRISGRGVRACFVLCEAARDYERKNGHTITAIEPDLTNPKEK
jgi:hypothetical protein